MSTSFEEKSTWIQLVSTLLCLGAYFLVAHAMYREGIIALQAYVPLFIAAVFVLVVLLVSGHILAAVLGRSDQADERDRLIGWKAESYSSWVLGVGTLTAITGLVLTVEPVLVAHLLLMSLFVAEVLKCSLQLLFYRRGV